MNQRETLKYNNDGVLEIGGASWVELAKQFGISRSTFCSVFPQFTGMPLQKYVAQKRIKEAQILIRSCPEKSISQIALEVGYQDDSTFYRNFLRITGVSPLKYKNNFHKF